MRDPVLRIQLPVELSTLYINVLVTSIKVDVLHRRRLARQSVLDADLGEERWQDEVDVLSAHWPQAHHGQSAKGTHGTGIVVTGDTIHTGIELRGDVVVGKVRRQAWTTSIVEQEDEKEGLFVTKVEQVGSVVKELETLDKSVWATKRGDEVGHVVGGEESVEPAAALVGLRWRH